MKLIESLREKAGKATNGPYSACHNGDCKCGMVWSKPADAVVCCVVGASDENITLGEGFTDEQKANNARFIASCSPEVITALCGAAEALSVISAGWLPDDCGRIADAALAKLNALEQP